jgi:predicted amidohydrolase
MHHAAARLGNFLLQQPVPDDGIGMGVEALPRARVSSRRVRHHGARLRLAEANDGAQVEQLSTAAGRIGIAIVAGFAERAGNRVYNAALLVTAEGGRHLYRKCQLYGDYEKRLFEPGPAAPAVFDVDAVKLGMLICFDVEFPELVRGMALAGAGVIVVPTALPDNPVFRMIPDRMISVRAFENQIPIVYSNHAGADPAFSFAGRSVICLPDGSEAARAPRTGDALIFADYEPANFLASRETNCYLGELRKDHFRIPIDYP